MTGTATRRMARNKQKDEKQTPDHVQKREYFVHEEGEQALCQYVILQPVVKQLGHCSTAVHYDRHHYEGVRYIWPMHLAVGS